MNTLRTLRDGAAMSPRVVALRNRTRGHNSQKVKGTGNLVDYGSAVLTGCSITIIGSGSRVLLGAGCRLRGVSITLRGDNHSLTIGDRCQLTDTEFAFEDFNGKISVGAGTTSQGGHIAVAEPSMCVEIGEDCMFSRDIYLATTDSHTILDVATGKRLNPPADIRIGEHVWLGASVKVLKGVQIGSGSIVGIGSVVTHSVESGTAVAGNPARVIRHGVAWTRPRL